MNNIKITVSGTSGSGKSTIAALILRCLQSHGLNDVVIFSEDHDADDIAAHLDNNISRLIDKETKIEIYEQQLLRTLP